MRRVRVALLLSAGAWAAALHGACGSRETDGGGGRAAVAAATTGTGFVSDGAHICGNEFHDALTKYPLIYLVLDRSGSMQAVEDGATRYEKVRLATLDFVDTLGALVRVGVTIFPAEAAGPGSECLAGTEVYSPKVDPGAAFAAAIDTDPWGGTPTAATLQYVRPKLASQPAPKVVILATDGGPNCNSSATCTAAECVVNLAGECPAGVNCCQPPDGFVENCLDRVPTLDAIEALAAEGTPVYVVGIPGSQPFATVLNQMALAGGVPLAGAAQYYYRVDDLDGLAEVFKGIASDLVSCTFDLTDAPAEQGLTNVYVNGEVLVQDPVNGWVWLDADTIELVGAACDQLKSGAVEQVQIVSGCPTETPL